MHPPVLSSLYAAIARRRRERYAARPDLRQRLRHPVISIGNLAVGGRGKTPLAASVARMLLEMGEKPAILSRGYGRARKTKEVVIVRDAREIRAGLDVSGDEPMMLARQLPGVVVLTCSDRYRAGVLAETELGATVHVLDDGFQHLQLDRDIDLVIVGREDVERPLTLPGGRLREPLDTIVAADAVLTEDPDLVVESEGLDLPVFRLVRSTPRDRGIAADAAGGQPVLGLAGIAAPQRFFDDLRGAGWNVAQTMAFRDHHRYDAEDLVFIAETAGGAGAEMIVTTEKDYVRLLPLEPWPLPIDFVPIELRPEPFDEFRAWIASELMTTRGQSVG
jgi:tetraacyldisaccharide 4'-kinase